MGTNQPKSFPQFTLPALFFAITLAAIFLGLVKSFGSYGLMGFLYLLFALPLLSCISKRPIHVLGVEIRQFHPSEIWVFAVVLLKFQIIHLIAING